MFSCYVEPVPPSREERAKDNGDQLVSLYITDLAYAGRDCRKQLEEVENLLELQEGVLITDTIAREEKPEEPKRRWGLF